MGDPNPVKSDQTVACHIRARCSLGHPLVYHWYAEDGEFDHTNAAEVTWFPPENCSGNEQTYEIGCRVVCTEDMSVQETRSFQQSVEARNALTLADILGKYETFGTTAHTWPDGTAEAKPLVGRVGSGALNNLLASLNRIRDKNPYTRYACDAMQYKVMCGFLQKLKEAGLLQCWEFRAVEGVCPPYPVHHAVVLWRKGTDWKRKGVILDPHGKQKPDYYGTETDLFDWHMEVTRDGRYNDVDPCVLAPPWQERGGSEQRETAKGFAVMCPVDVLIANSRGRRLGVGSDGEYLEEFSPIDTSFSMDETGDKQWFFLLPDDIYIVYIIGTDSGDFRLVTTTSSGRIHDYGTNPVEKGRRHRLDLNATDDRLTLAGGATPPYRIVEESTLQRQTGPEHEAPGDAAPERQNPLPIKEEGIPGIYILTALGVMILLLLLAVLKLSSRKA